MASRVCGICKAIEHSQSARTCLHPYCPFDTPDLTKHPAEPDLPGPNKCDYCDEEAVDLSQHDLGRNDVCVLCGGFCEYAPPRATGSRIEARTDTALGAFQHELRALIVKHEARARVALADELLRMAKEFAPVRRKD